jgi:hypothetical protein
MGINTGKKHGRPAYNIPMDARPMTLRELRDYRDSLPRDDRDPGAIQLGDPPSWRSALALKRRGDRA